MSHYAIGIDLGTTYSCVGVVKDGQVRIIHNDYGFTTTASCIAFTERERLVGEPAKAQIIRNYQNTIFDTKRLIGRNFADKSVQADIKHWPFKVVDNNGICGVLVQFKKQTKTFSPEELSAMVLTKMKETAEAFLRQPVTDAVITVPAYFNDSQRQATKDAAAIAGLNVLRIINEPTAAGIAYALDEKTPKKQNILIYDLGGGTFDVTVMTIENKNFTVKSTSGDTHLGGEDFDSCLVDYCLSDIKEKHNTDISSNKRALRKLRTACETAKRLLSYHKQTTIEVDGLIDGDDFSLEIGRSRFEEICFHLFKKTLDSVNKALADAKMTKENIDEIILVGGSTRIPRIKRLVMDHFNGKKLNNTVHPDEAVAYGAAIQAAVLAGNTTDLVRNVKIQDVTPITLGLRTHTGSFDRKNTLLPAKKTKLYVTVSDYQERALVAVYEGENDRYIDNDFLGDFRLLGLQKALKGDVEFDIVFEIDENGILDVKATERGTNNTGNIQIVRNTGYLSRKSISEMVKNEEKYAADDRELKLAAGISTL